MNTIKISIAEEHLALQQDVAQVLADAPSQSAAPHLILEALGKRLGWPVGILWGIDSGGTRLRCIETWRVDSSRWDAFVSTSQNLTLLPGEALPGSVWRTAAPAWISDMCADKVLPRNSGAETDGLHAALAFPVAVGKSLLGVIEFVHPNIQDPDNSLLRVLGSLGRQIGLFFGLKQAERSLAERTRLETLRADVGEALTGSDPIAMVLQRCAESVVEHLGVAFARIWVRHGDLLELNASAGLYTHLNGAHSKIKLGDFKIGRIAKDQRPHLTNDVLHDPEVSDKEWAAREGMVAFAGYPLQIGGGVVGVLAMFARQALAPGIIHELKPLADAIAVFIDRKNTEDELRDSEERSRLLLESSSEGIFGLDLEGNCTFVNPACVRLLGYDEPAQLLGKPAHELFHHTRRDGTPYPSSECRISQCLGSISLSVKSADEVFWRRDGSSISVDYRANSVRGGNRNLGAVVTFVDTSLSRRAEEAMRLRESALRAIAQGIFITDPNRSDEGLSYVNVAFERMTGYTLREVQRRDIEFLRGPETDSDAIEQVRTAYENGLEVSVEVLIYRKDKTSFWATLALSPVNREAGKVTHFVGVLTDISERKRFEENLLEAKAAAESANVAKSQFLASMSHELRTPLNAVIMYSELLQEESVDRGLSDFVPDLEKIRLGGKHLLSLVNGVLDLSKIEAGKMELSLETFDIASMIHEVVGTVQPLVGKKSNTLDVRCPTDIGEMHADLTKIRQILFNLVSNACKFTENGTITLEVCRVSQGADQCIDFQVSDSGIGMSPEQVAKLFQPFAQADASTTRKYGGTGLGLVITKHFCEMIGGTIGVVSELGKGAKFTAHLPAIVRESVLATSEPLQKHLASPVLVIDDDGNVRDLLSRTLTAQGIRTVTSADGEEGLRIAATLRPAVIFLDVLLPRMDGWAVLTALKSNPDLADTPVVMMTINEKMELGYLLGASEYLTKPIDRNRLTQLVQKYHINGTPANVLLVEDDDSTRDVIRRTLVKQGWTVAEAANGRIALQQVARHAPSLILLDLMMPGMDGFEFLSELRKASAWQNIPVVVLTSKDLTIAERQFLNGNVEMILQKGMYGREAILQEVKRVVAKHTEYSSGVT